MSADQNESTVRQNNESPEIVVISGLLRMVRGTGLEPVTPCTSSNRVMAIYAPTIDQVQRKNYECMVIASFSPITALCILLKSAWEYRAVVLMSECPNSS